MINNGEYHIVTHPVNFVYQCLHFSQGLAQVQNEYKDNPMNESDKK